MKLERMIGILSILLQKEKVTAPYLAENLRFPDELLTGISKRFVWRNFSKREVPPPNLPPQEFFTPRYQVKAKIQPEYKWWLIEEYGPESFSVLPEGTLLLAFGEGIRKKYLQS